MKIDFWYLIVDSSSRSPVNSAPCLRVAGIVDSIGGHDAEEVFSSVKVPDDITGFGLSRLFQSYLQSLRSTPCDLTVE